MTDKVNDPKKLVESEILSYEEYMLQKIGMNEYVWPEDENFSVLMVTPDRIREVRYPKDIDLSEPSNMTKLLRAINNAILECNLKCKETEAKTLTEKMIEAVKNLKKQEV